MASTGTSWIEKARLALRRRYEIRKEGLIDVLDANGVPTGEAVNIYDLHERGLWHRTANVYILNTKGEVLLQQRSQFVKTYPNMWSVSAGGHIRSGHTSLEAMVGEVSEELGLAIAPEEFIPIRSTRKEEPQQGGYDREFQDTFIVHKEIDISTLSTQEHEVGSVAWVPIEEYRRLVASKDPDHVIHASLPAFFEYIDSHVSDKN